MSNVLLPERYTERVQRLALGVEPIDAAREQPMLMPVTLTHDDAPHRGSGAARPPFLRHPSNRQTLLYDAYYAAAPRTVTLRLFDSAQALYSVDTDRRRFIPRRLLITLPALADAELAPPSARACRPWLMPAAAYPLSDAVTGLRAHAMRAAAGPRPLRPARWASVWATVPATQPLLALSTVVARAVCDERGEFLLIVRPHPATLGPGPTLPVRLRVFAAPETDPVPRSWPGLDPLWDLPIEAPASLADTDPVLRGEALPAGYGPVAERSVDLPLGRLLRGQPALLI